MRLKILLLFLLLVLTFLILNNKTVLNFRPSGSKVPVSSMAQDKPGSKSNKLYFDKETAREINFSLIDIANYFNVVTVDAGYYVISENNWQDYFSKKTDRVDFQKYIYLGVSLGERSTGGYKVEILDINQIEEQVFISTKIDEPASSDFVIQIITNPYQFIEIDKTLLGEGTDLKFNFVDEGSIRLKTINVSIGP